MDKEDDLIQDGDVDSDNDSVDSMQLLADITDVINSSSGGSNVDLFGREDVKIVEEYPQPARDQEAVFTIVSDDKSLKSTFSQDVDFLEKQEKPLLEKDQRVERLHNDPNDSIESKVVAIGADSIKNTAEQPVLTFISQQKCVPGDPKKDPFHITLKEPVIRLTKLDPDIKMFKVESVTSVLSDAHLHSLETEHSMSKKKVIKQGEVKKSVWHDESSPLSDFSMSEVSTDKDKTVKVSSTISLSDTNTVTLKVKEEKLHVIKCQERDKISKTLDKNPLLDSGHHKTIDAEISSEKLKTAHSSAAKSKNIHSYNNTSSQFKKHTSSSSGTRSNNATNKSKAFETCSKNTEKNMKVAEKSKQSAVSDSRKRTLSKDDRGIEASSHSCNNNPKRMLKEDRKLNEIKNEYDWCFELHLTPFGIEDLSDESFRKFVNLASDCAISFESNRSGKNQGHVHLYFGCLSNMQSGMHKLSQLSLMSPKALHGIIKCCHIKPTSGVESNFNWKSLKRLGFSMFTSWTLKMKQLVQVKDWKQDEKTKRKCAQIQRIPPFVSKEMISLLFPFSLNVHSPKPNTGDQKKDLQGHTEIEFENTAWMETVLSCFRDFYVAKVGSGNSEWRLEVTNFKPPIDKIPEPHVTSSQSDITTKDKRELKMSADLARKDMFKGRTADCHNKVKCSDGYQSQLKEPASDSGKDGCRTRKRPFRLSDSLSSKGATAEKKSKPLDETHVIRNVDQNDGSTSQNSATDKDHLRLIAQAKGLDPDNVDVIRILEVQNQLTSLQALFSSTLSEERASLPLDQSHSADIAQGYKRSNADLNSRGLTTKKSMTISAAEQQLRENIAMKQKQLKKLEEKLQWKRGNPKVNRQIRSSESVTKNLTGDFLTQMKGSENNTLLGQNDEPLDFTKPTPKIEEAVKKDEERSKMLAVKSSTPQQSQGKSVNSLQSANSADDFALPLQFGKNVKKTVTDIAATEGKGILRTFDRPISESYRGMKPPNKNDHSPGNRMRENEANRVFNVNSGPLRSQAKSEGRETLDRDRFFVSSQSGDMPNIASFHDSCGSDHQRSKQNLSDDYRRGEVCRENTSYRQFHESEIDKESVRVEMQWRGKDNPAVNNFATDNPSTLNEMDYDINKRQYQSWKSGNGRNPSEAQQRIPDESFHASFKGKHREDFQSRPEEMGSKFSFESDPGLGRDSSYSKQFNHLGKNVGPADYRQRNEQANPREISRKNHQAQHPGSSNILWEEERMFDDIDGFEHQHRDLRQRQNINVEEGYERLDEGVQFQGSGLIGRGNALRGSAIQTRGRGVSLQRDIRFSGEDWNGQKASEMRLVGLESQSKVVIAKDRELYQSAEMTGVGTDPHMDSRMRRNEVGRARRGMEPHRNNGMRGRSVGVTGTGVEPQRGLQSSTGDRDPETMTPRNERDMEIPNIIGYRGHARGRGAFPMRGRSTGQQKTIEMNEQNIMELENMTDHSERGVVPLHYSSMNMRGRGIEYQRGIGLRGRDLKFQSGSRMRGRGREYEKDIEYQRDMVMNRKDNEPCRSTEMSGTNRESQSGVGLRGRGMHIERSLEIKERGIDYQGNTVLGCGRGFSNISNLSDARGKQNSVRDYEGGIERSFTESHEEETLAGVSLGGLAQAQGTRGRGPSELHGYKEGAVQRGRGRGLDNLRGGSVSRGESYGNRYSNMPKDLTSEQDASFAIDHPNQNIRSKVNQDPEESIEYSQNVPFRTNIGRQASFSNAPSQRSRGTGRGLGVPQRGSGHERHIETPQRGAEVDRSFGTPQRAGGVDRHLMFSQRGAEVERSFGTPQRVGGVDGHLGPPQRGGGVDRHLRFSQRGDRVDGHLGSPQRGDGLDRHLEPSQRGDGVDRHPRPSQRGGGFDGHLGPSQRGGGVDRNPRPSQRGGGFDGHLGPSQRGGGVDRHLGPSQRGDGVDRHLGPLQGGGEVERHLGTPQRGGGVDRHPGPSQRGGEVERHHGIPHRGGRVDRHFGSSQRVDDVGSFGSFHDGSRGSARIYRGRGNLKTGQGMADGRGRGMGGQFQNNLRARDNM